MFGSLSALVHFVSGQYEDMKADLGAAVHAVARFLQVDLTEAEARTRLGGGAGLSLGDYPNLDARKGAYD